MIVRTLRIFLFSRNHQKSLENMKFGLKWVHMARYELILKLDGALWLTIISKPLLTPKKAMEGPTTRLLYNGPVTTKIPYTNKKSMPIWPHARTTFLGYFAQQ